MLPPDYMNKWKKNGELYLIKKSDLEKKRPKFKVWFNLFSLLWRGSKISITTTFLFVRRNTSVVFSKWLSISRVFCSELEIKLIRVSHRFLILKITWYCSWALSFRRIFFLSVLFKNYFKEYANSSYKE